MLVLGAVVVLLAAAAPGSAAAAAPAAAPDGSDGTGDGPRTARLVAGRWRAPLDGPLQVGRRFAPPVTAYGAGHRGVDLVAAPGAPVRAAGAGTVTYAGLLAGRGVVTVTHGALRTTYEPVAQVRVAVGRRVAGGDVLGTLAAGHAGCRGAGCLHWGLLRGPDHLDPLGLLRTRRVRLLPLEGVRLDAPAAGLTSTDLEQRPAVGAGDRTGATWSPAPPTRDRPAPTGDAAAPGAGPGAGRDTAPAGGVDRGTALTLTVAGAAAGGAGGLLVLAGAALARGPGRGGARGPGPQDPWRPSGGAAGAVDPGGRSTTGPARAWWLEPPDDPSGRRPTAQGAEVVDLRTWTRGGRAG